jgi:hypothetical protein
VSDQSLGISRHSLAVVPREAEGSAVSSQGCSKSVADRLDEPHYSKLLKVEGPFFCRPEP